MRALQTIIRENLLENVKVLGVAVSGGSDSMSLLAYLVAHIPQRIKVINIEHGIRGENSKKDSMFVEEFCRANNLEYIGKKCDCLQDSRLKGENLELNAKKARYDIFHDLINSGVVDAVATAHNQSDSVESVLMHLLRGSGLKGVCGIEYRTKKGVIRPLLDTSKAEVLAYLEQENIPYVDDETNADIKYTRNYLRKEVVPQLLKVNEKAIENILSFMSLAREDERVLCDISTSFVLGTCVKKEAFENSAIGYRAAKKALEILGERTDFLRANYDSIVALTKNGQTAELANGVRASLEYEHIRFYYDTEIKNEELPFALGCFAFGEYAIELLSGESDGLKIRHCEKLKSTAIIRGMREGDTFKSCNGYTKKLSKYFTDKKIPKAIRGSIPLLCVGSEIVAIFGIEIADSYKTQKGQEILTLALRNKNGESVLLSAINKEKA